MKMKIILLRSGVLLFMHLFKISAESVVVHPRANFFVSEEVRVKRQAGYVYNKPGVSFDLPSQAPIEAPIVTTQAPTVDRTQAQMMYYAYPAPAPRPAVNNVGKQEASAGATAGYNYAQQGSGPSTADTSSATGSNQASAGSGQTSSSGSSGYAYDTPATGSSGANSISIGSQSSNLPSSSAVDSGAGYAYNTPAPNIQMAFKVDVSTSGPQYLPPLPDSGITGGAQAASEAARIDSSGGYGSGPSSGSAIGYTRDTSTNEAGASNGGYSRGPLNNSEGGSPDASVGVDYSRGAGGYSGGPDSGAEAGYSSGPSISSSGRTESVSSEGTVGGYSTSGVSATATLSDQYLPPLNQPKAVLLTNQITSISTSDSSQANGPNSVPNSAYIPPNRVQLPSPSPMQKTGGDPTASLPNSAYIPPKKSPLTPISTRNGATASVSISYIPPNPSLTSIPDLPTSNPNTAYIPPSRSSSAPDPTPRPFAPARPSADYLPPNSDGSPKQESVSTPASGYLPPIF